MARKKASRSRSGPSRNRGLGMLFWLCLAVIVVAVGFAARESLKAALAQVAGKPAQPPTTARPAVTVAPLTETDRQAPAARPAPAPEPRRAPTAAPAPSAPQPVVPEKPTVRKARLYFTSVDSNGVIRLKSVIRSIPSSDSPLRDTLENMLKGPTAQELNLGFVSMIPTDARLRSVTVKGETAFVDFSQSFRFNAQGLDAMDAQLRQVVYAATEFPSVKNVQILIEGATVRYLGTEGMRLDAPLSRTSFQN